MRCVGSRCGGDVKVIHDGGRNGWRQFQDGKKHTWHCVRTVLRRIREGMKA